LAPDIQTSDPALPPESGEERDGGDPRVAVRGLTKSYRLGEERINVLRGLSLSLAAGEMVAIMGPSGSGKTTLLNCISGIDRPDSGDVVIDGKSVDFASETARTNLRRHSLGMVFQFFNLVPTLTVRENVALPFLIAHRDGPEARKRIDGMLERIGIAQRADHRPYQLSGGEMQLTSIARALVHGPAALLADEPTGNVNPAVGRSIMRTLQSSARSDDTAVLLVTHSAEHAAWADRILFLKDGAIAGEYRHDGDAADLRPIHDALLKLGI
jgi:putative ABC transport system ATP-binding protein